MRPTSETTARAGEGCAGEVSAQQLAHELASLLDGAMRCLRLATGRIEPVHAPAAALANLRLASDALARMTELLEAAMAETRPHVRTLASRQSLRDGAERVVALLGPMADERRVRLGCQIDPAVASLPCGLIEVVLLNGVRNAIEAAAGSATTPGVVDVRLETRGDRLHVLVRDSGPGPEATGRAPGGHGLGLELCRQIAAELGGTLELVGGDASLGTELRVDVPVATLAGGPS